MQVWNVGYSTRLAKNTGRKNSPSARYRTTSSGCIFATKARIDNRKNLLSSNNYLPRCPHNRVNFGPLRAEIDLPVWGTSANFNWFRVLASLLPWILPCAKFTLRPSLAFSYIGSITAGTPAAGSIFFRRLISAVADWMFTIGLLRHNDVALVWI